MKKPANRQKSDEPQSLEIRKYPNRRYYDTTRSCHLNIEQIHKLIVAGYNVRIVDAQTEEEITSNILTRILLEYEPAKLDLFSGELLTRAIRVNDRLLRDFRGRLFPPGVRSLLRIAKAIRGDVARGSSAYIQLDASRGLASRILPPWPIYGASQGPRSGVLPAPAPKAAREAGPAGDHGRDCRNAKRDCSP